MKEVLILFILWSMIQIQCYFIENGRFKVFIVIISGLVSIWYLYFHSSILPIWKMLSYIFILFMVMKIWISSLIDKFIHNITFADWLIYTYFWIGVNPRPFFTDSKKSISIDLKDVYSAMQYFFLGLFSIVISNFFIKENVIIGNWILLIGISLTFHFGLIKFYTLLFRKLGFPVSFLFKNPLHAKTLREFWGQRWNTAFSEMTASIVYKPIAKHSGKHVALICSFLFSGILHELAITLPMVAEFGKPTLYFLIQSVLIIVEMLYRIESKLWVVMGTFGFLPLVFPDKFIDTILIPILIFIK